MDTKIRDKYFVLTETQYESVKAVTVHSRVVGYLAWIKKPSNDEFTSQLLKVIAAYENAVNGEFFKGCADYSNWGNGWEWIETYVRGLDCHLVNVESHSSHFTSCNSLITKFPIKGEGLKLKERFRNYAPADRAYYFSVK